MNFGDENQYTPDEGRNIVITTKTNLGTVFRV